MGGKLRSRPFYLQPPWDILFDIQRLRRIRPWDIKISFLLMSFLREMETRKEVDFRASGIALDSSATIYLMKSKLLLKLEEPPPIVKEKLEFVPPPIILPLRYELTTTTIEHLLEALDEALKGKSQLTVKNRIETIVPPPAVIPKVSLFLLELEEEMKRLHEKMIKLARDGLILFSDLVSDMPDIEKIKTFMILLFMAQEGKVNLWQRNNFEEIYISLIEE